MEYLVTWYEGDDVIYKLLSSEELADLEPDKDYIVCPLN